MIRFYSLRLDDSAQRPAHCEPDSQSYVRLSVVPFPMPISMRQKQGDSDTLPICVCMPALK